MDKKRSKGLLTLLLAISMFLATVVYTAPVSADAGSPPADALYVSDRIVVKFKEGPNSAYVAQLHAGQGTTVVDEIPQIGVQILSVPPGEVEARIAAYKVDPRVEYAEPVYIARPAYEPNDLYYKDGTQWGPQKIQASLAWDLCTGDPDVVIAVLDWGVDFQHPDLEAKIWTNPNETTGDANGDGYPGVEGVDDDGDSSSKAESNTSDGIDNDNDRLVDENGIDFRDEDVMNADYDNDGTRLVGPDGKYGTADDDADDVALAANDDDENGFADDIKGWDFANDDNDPQDDYGHGTHVAGIAAAATDNGVGIAGVAFNSRIMAVKVGNGTTGLAMYPDIAKGIIYAADNGADVINLSLGNNPSSSYMQYAVNLAWNAGCVVVAAAGNGGSSDPFYPAAFENVIGVSSTDQSDVRASSSNYGSYISVAAPGSSIYSTYWNGGSTYAYMSGTSMSAPHVAGLAALLFAQDGARTNATVRSLIEDSADDLGDAGWDQYYGYGRINAYRALGAVSAVIEPVTGGSLSADNGDLTLDFLAGSVANSTTVTYTPNAAPGNPTGDLIFANMDCVLEATDGQGDPVTQFDPPYTLTLRYQDTDWQNAGIEDESTLNLYYWNGSQWEGVLPCAGCSLDIVSNKLVAVLGHFSEFGLMGENGSPTAITLSSFAANSSAGLGTPLVWSWPVGVAMLAMGGVLWVRRRSNRPRSDPN